ncbi:hypothetical protein LLP99_17200 [Rouxiella badensis]|uniref:hypothetical protein n=1 Tax=Rouxiella badensis TaxID=1646377 RepID=UPI001D150741|nr:hypothetical protein [Rouxiella badensis]MCC3717936.1 hypothetical protein [Rouxiella badensis]MCC3730049.1 hypothetical protein [Rouxiella badensis]
MTIQIFKGVQNQELALKADYDKLAAECGALQAANIHAALCINAAMVEGLLEALAESNDDRLVDLVNRRLLHAYQEVNSPLTEEQLWQMGDAILLEQLKDGTSFIARQSEIIANQNQRIAELESKTTAAAIAEWKARGVEEFVSELSVKLRLAGGEDGRSLVYYGEYADHMESKGEDFAAKLRAGVEP